MEKGERRMAVWSERDRKYLEDAGWVVVTSPVAAVTVSTDPVESVEPKKRKYTRRK